jgi:hypothetical protein
LNLKKRNKQDGRDISAYRTNVLDKESIMTDDLQLGPMIYLDGLPFFMMIFTSP